MKIVTPTEEEILPQAMDIIRQTEKRAEPAPDDADILRELDDCADVRSVADIDQKVRKRIAPPRMLRDTPS